MTSTGVDLQAISAFAVYKKSQNKQKIKKKKQKQVPEHSLTTIKKSKLKKKSQNDIKKHSSIIKVTNFKEKSNRKKEQSNVTVLPKKLIEDNPLAEAVELFEWLIAPVTLKTFFETYWEQQPVHIKRSNERYYSQLLDSATVDKILRYNSLFYTRNIDVVTYENGIKEVHNPEGRAVASAVWDYYTNGCSIRILNPHTYNNKIHLLLVTLQEYFGSMVGANVYLTPPNSQGFAPHYDDIEAFVIQLEGRKHWKLYQPKGADILARDSSNNLSSSDIGEPFMSLTLNPGEILYFPRGTIHEGRTDPESHSLHITVSVYQRNSYADLLEHILPNALKKAAANNVEFRKGLPLNYLKNFGITSNHNSDDRNPVIKKVKCLLQLLEDYIDVDNAADQLGRRLMYDSMPPLLSKNEAQRSSRRDGPYLKQGKVINRVEINLDTKVRLLRFYCLRVVSEESSLKLYYNTENAKVYHDEEEQWLELDSGMLPIIKKLQNEYPNYVKVYDLPSEDDGLKVQLISDLWEHGLLVTQDPLETIDEDEPVEVNHYRDTSVRNFLKLM